MDLYNMGTLDVVEEEVEEEVEGHKKMGISVACVFICMSVCISDCEYITFSGCVYIYMCVCLCAYLFIYVFTYSCHSSCSVQHVPSLSPPVVFNTFLLSEVELHSGKDKREFFETFQVSPSLSCPQSPRPSLCRFYLSAV